MAFTSKGAAWERKNSTRFIFAFFPLLQAIPFLHMNSKIPNKKWKTCGIVCLVATLVLSIVAITFCATAFWNTPYDLSDYSPNSWDYITDSEFEIKYAEEIKNDGLTIEETPEYKEYEQALSDWLDSDEHDRMQEENDHWLYTFMALAGVCVALLAALYITMLISAFNQRVIYLRQLAKMEDEAAANPYAYMKAKNNGVNPINRAQSINQAVPMNQPPQQPVQPVQQPVQPQAQSINQMPSQPAVQPQQPVSVPSATKDEVKIASQPEYALNVNTATEEDIDALPGLTIVDAKKAIAYREANGIFKTVDEFFESMGTMPHVMVNIMDSVYAGDKNEPVAQTVPEPAPAVQPEQPAAQKQESASPKRRIDL